MKKCEEVSNLPRRRDAALAAPYKTEETTSPFDERKNSKARKFTATSLRDKYFKL